jgi:hypothetical protein
VTDASDHGNEPRAEEIALHQRFLTLLGQMETAQSEGNEIEPQRLRALLERAGDSPDNSCAPGVKARARARLQLASAEIR